MNLSHFIFDIRLYAQIRTCLDQIGISFTYFNFVFISATIAALTNIISGTSDTPFNMDGDDDTSFNW